jgi:hypothetical protein
VDGRVLHTPVTADLDISVLQKQGCKLFVDLGNREGRKILQQMSQVRNSLDRIGRQHVTEEKVSIALRESKQIISDAGDD